MTFLLCSGRRKFIDLIQIPIIFNRITTLSDKYWRFYFFYLYYLYCLSIFQRTCCFRFKSGCKGKGFIFNYQTFSEVFFSFSFYAGFSGSLCERERMYERITLANFLCESDSKDKNFSYYNPNFFGSFLFFSLSGIPLFH